MPTTASPKIGRPALALLLLAVSPVLFSGCNEKLPPIVPVKGEVYYYGRTVPGVIVTFHPLDKYGQRIRISTTKEGAFQITCRAGRYKVTVEPFLDEPEGSGSVRRPISSLSLPERYADQQQTDLQVTIPETGHGTLVLLLER